MKRIELDDQTAESLAARASALGMTIDEYVRSLVVPRENGHAHALDELDAE
jgi:hypothetical protein